MSDNVASIEEYQPMAIATDPITKNSMGIPVTFLRHIAAGRKEITDFEYHDEVTRALIDLLLYYLEEV